MPCASSSRKFSVLSPKSSYSRRLLFLLPPPRLFSSYSFYSLLSLGTNLRVVASRYCSYSSLGNGWSSPKSQAVRECAASQSRLGCVVRSTLMVTHVLASVSRQPALSTNGLHCCSLMPTLVPFSYCTLKAYLPRPSYLPYYLPEFSWNGSRISSVKSLMNHYSFTRRTQARSARDSTTLSQK